MRTSVRGAGAQAGPQAGRGAGTTSGGHSHLRPQKYRPLAATDMRKEGRPLASARQRLGRAER
jgi:hypothetical protein